MVSRIRSIGWGTLAAVVVTSSGCMGGSSPLASARPTAAPPQLAAQGGPGAASATGPGSGITQALWDNPVSRTVKSAFSDDASISYAGAGGNMSSSDPLSLSHPGKPPSADLYVSMGLMAERSGNLEKANEFYDRAVKQEPQNADALLAYGHFHDRQGRLDVAMQLYLEALRFDPNHAGAHNDLGLCYARQGELPRALQEVRRAAELRPDRPIYRNNVAKVLVEMDRGDRPRARERPPLGTGALQRGVVFRPVR